MSDSMDVPKNKLYVPGPDVIDVTPDKDRGVLKEILRAGEGHERPKEGYTVSVHYIGTLLVDGTTFDSSRSRNKEFAFSLGLGSLIKALDIGITTMLRGELAVFQCAPEYSYGSKGSPPLIPADATLVFEVELLSWKGEDVSEAKDGSILKIQIKDGEGYKQPHEISSCLIHLIGRHNGREFQNEKISFVVGEVIDGSIVPGVEAAVQTLRLNETSKFEVKAKHAYGAGGNTKFDLPAGADVEYEIELLDLVDLKESWQLDMPQKFDEAEVAKAKGTEFFNAGRFEVALRYYKRIIEMVSIEDHLVGEEAERRVSLLMVGHLNMALCHLKLNNNAETIEACEEALKLDVKNEKALYRRGAAMFNLRNYELAISDFRMVLSVDASNKTAKNQLMLATEALKEARSFEKKTYGGMFEKFAIADAKRDKANSVGKKVREIRTEGNEDKEDNEDTAGKVVENVVEYLEKPDEVAPATEQATLDT